MENIRKAAILLLTLEKPLAAEVLSQMPRDMVESVTLEIAGLDDVTQEQRDCVLGEFYSMTKQGSLATQDGRDVYTDSSPQSPDVDGAIEAPVPFGFLQTAGADNVMKFIVDEHPQTIALILSHLPASLAAELLSSLPSARQSDVIRRVANIEHTDDDVLRDVESSLASRMNQQMLEIAGITHQQPI